MKNLSYIFSDFVIALITLNYFVIKKILKKETKLKKEKSVLDVGCGTGILAPLYSSKKYLGVDVDKKAIGYAKKKYPKYKFKFGDATILNLKKKFKLITVIGVIHHLNNKQTKDAFFQIKSHLAKDGKAVVVEAIPPISKINIIGKLLRSFDKGHHVRKLKDYKKMTGDLKIVKSYEKKGGLVDYGVLVLSS